MVCSVCTCFTLGCQAWKLRLLLSVPLCQRSMEKESHRELSAKFEQLQIKGSSLAAGHYYKRSPTSSQKAATNCHLLKTAKGQLNGSTQYWQADEFVAEENSPKRLEDRMDDKVSGVRAKEARKLGGRQPQGEKWKLCSKLLAPPNCSSWIKSWRTTVHVSLFCNHRHTLDRLAPHLVFLALFSCSQMGHLRANGLIKISWPYPVNNVCACAGLCYEVNRSGVCECGSYYSSHILCVVCIRVYIVLVMIMR